MKTTGIIIRNIRDVKGYSQEYLANELGIGQAAYSKIESGVTDITLSRLYKIAELLEVSVYDLIPTDDNKPNQFNEPSPKYHKGNSNGYELSVTIKLNDPSKENEILKMIGMNK